MPVDVRNLALAVIAVILSLYALQWAKAVVVPLLLGVMFSYALSPAIDRMERWRFPRAASAGLLLTAILAGLGGIGWGVSDDADALIETLPEVAQKLRKALQKPGQSTSPSTLEKVQQAATEIERATEETALPTTASARSRIAVLPRWRRARARVRPCPRHRRRDRVEPMSTTVPATPRGVTRVVVEKPRIDIKDYLWTGTLGLVTLAGQATLVIFITFFLLASGSTFRRKMVKLAGPRLSQKKITVQALDEVHEQMQRYLFVQMAHQRRRRHPLGPGLLRPRPQPLAGLGHPRGRHQPRSVPRRGGDRRRLDRHRHRPVRVDRSRALHRRRVVRHPYARGQPAGALVDGPRRAG